MTRMGSHTPNKLSRVHVYTVFTHDIIVIAGTSTYILPSIVFLSLHTMPRSVLAHAVINVSFLGHHDSTNRLLLDLKDIFIDLMLTSSIGLDHSVN
jgi:hypothetical protein